MFGEIIHILKADTPQTVVIFVRLGFDEHLYAYAVQKTKDYEMTN